MGWRRDQRKYEKMCRSRIAKLDATEQTLYLKWLALALDARDEVLAVHSVYVIGSKLFELPQPPLH